MGALAPAQALRFNSLLTAAALAAEELAEEEAVGLWQPSWPGHHLTVAPVQRRLCLQRDRATADAIFRVEQQLYRTKQDMDAAKLRRRPVQDSNLPQPGACQAAGTAAVPSYAACQVSCCTDQGSRPQAMPAGTLLSARRPLLQLCQMRALRVPAPAHCSSMCGLRRHSRSTKPGHVSGV